MRKALGLAALAAAVFTAGCAVPEAESSLPKPPTRTVSAPEPAPRTIVKTVTVTVTPPPPPGPAQTFTDGVFEVGVDVVAGKYKTEGAPGCYWSRKQRNDGSSGDILDSNISDGPQTVTINEGEYFSSIRCSAWRLAS